MKIIPVIMLLLFIGGCTTCDHAIVEDGTKRFEYPIGQSF